MPQATAITLADAQGTPVNHVFNPVGRNQDGVFYYVDSSAANEVGNWRISVEIKRANPATQGQSATGLVNRVKIGLHEPVLETVSNSTVSGIAPAPTVAYIARSYTEFLLPARMTQLDRENIAKMTPLLLQVAQIKAVIEDGEYLW
jgi:hypothetical protein